MVRRHGRGRGVRLRVRTGVRVRKRASGHTDEGASRRPRKTAVRDDVATGRPKPSRQHGQHQRGAAKHEADEERQSTGACQRAVEICAPGSPGARAVQRPPGASLSRRWAALCFPSPSLLAALRSRHGRSLGRGSWVRLLDESRPAKHYAGMTPPSDNRISLICSSSTAAPPRALQHPPSAQQFEPTWKKQGPVGDLTASENPSIKERIGS